MARVPEWPLWIPDPAAGLREGAAGLERAVTCMRSLARSVSDSARLDSEHSPVKEADTRSGLAAVLAGLSAAVRACRQLPEAGPGPVAPVAPDASAPGPIAGVMEDHLEEARRRQHRLADLLQAGPAERPDGWLLRGEIMAPWTDCAPNSGPHWSSLPVGGNQPSPV